MPRTNESTTSRGGKRRRWGWRGPTPTLAVVALLAAACAPGDGTPDAEPDDDTEQGVEAPSDEDGADDGAAGDSSDDAEYTFTYSSFSSEAAAFEQVNIWALDQIEQRTDGRVRFERYFGGALLGAEDMLAGAVDGRTDLAAPSPSYHPSELPLAQVTTLPFVTTDVEAHSRAILELYQTSDAFRSEFEDAGVVMLWPHPLTISIVCTVEPIEGLDDLQGQQIRALGYINEALAEIGANPQAMPIPEVYEALERGVLDGASGTIWEGLPSSRVHEVASNCYDPGIGQYTSTFTIMNRGTFESLPDDIQQVFWDVTEQSVDQLTDIYEPVDREVCQEVREFGGEAEVFSEEDQQAWQDAVQDDIFAQWLDEAAGAGAAEPQVLLDEYLELIDGFEGASAYVPGVRACAEGLYD